MKPLTTGQKKFIYETLVFGRLHWLAKPVYDLLIGCELAVERGVDILGGGRPDPDDGLLDQVTAVVKTFERPRVARRLLASLRRRYPGLRVMVVDDSREPTTFTGVQNLHLPYNSGISAGRNEALARLDSPFVLILDDDFIFTRRTRLGQAVRTMVDYPEIDIMGGQVVDLPLYVMHDYRRAALFDTGAAPARTPGSRIGGLPVVEKVPNFFVGRAPRVREVGWNPKLKLLEHADFFSRARGVLTTVMNEELRVLHAKTPFDLKYMQVRHDTRRYQAILHSLYQHRHRSP